MNAKKLNEAIILTFAYYSRGQTLPDALVKMYAQDLSDLDPQRCVDAYANYRRDPKNKQFPLPAHIREMIEPQKYISPEAKAREVAARITSAVPKFGWNNSQEAKAFIGEEGWLAVQKQGGWQFVCENLGLTIQPSTFQAQVRDLLEGQFKYGSKVMEQSVGALSESEVRGGDLLQIGSFMKQLTGSGPEDAA